MSIQVPRLNLKIRELLLLLAFFVLPFGQGPLVNGLLVGVLIMSLIQIPGGLWVRALKEPVVLVSMGFYLLYLLSMFYSTDLERGWRMLETRLIFLLGPPVLFAHGYSSSARARKLSVQAFVAGNVAVLLSAIFWGLYRAAEAGSWYFVRPGGDYERYFLQYETLSRPFMHPGYLATYVGLALLLVFYGLLRGHFRSRVAGWGLLLFLGLGLVLLQGRINILALGIIVGGIVIGEAWRKRRIAWIYIPLIAGMLVVGGLYQWGPDSLVKRYMAFPDFNYEISGDQFNSATYRLAEWSSAALALEREPWLGYGVGDYRQALQEVYQERGFHEGLRHGFNAHNQYLETLLALGWLGLSFLVILLLLYGRIFWRRGQWALLAGLGFFCLCMITESMLERAWAVLLFNLFFPFFAAAPESGAESKIEPHKRN